MATDNTSIRAPQVPIDENYKELFASVNEYVHAYMSQPGHDNSHDYQHIMRVTSNANRILDAELKANPSTSYDNTALFLAALLHDVGDRKYAKPGEDVENQISALLRERGASEDMALRVQAVVNHVSYLHEVRNPEAVVATLQRYPELAIVQDADRLDAIGAIGVARCFSYGAAKFPEEPMTRAIDHFKEKLYWVADLMKTESGKEMAQRRKQVLEDFAKEYAAEAELSFVMQ